MKAVIIGSGNVATHLAKALAKADVNIAQVWSKHLESATVLAEQVAATPIADLSAIDLSAGICIIAIKDDAVAQIAEQLTGFKGIVCHTSGSVNLKVFEPYFANYGVFYPLQTFSKAREVNFKTIPLCVEANNADTLQVLSDLASLVSDQVNEVTSDKRKILHLAAVFACNFPNHLYNLAADILKDHQLSFNLLRPLILETAEKVQHHLPKEVQTGPAIRHDEQTMQKHLDLLGNDDEASTIYKILSDSIKKSK